MPSLQKIFQAEHVIDDVRKRRYDFLKCFSIQLDIPLFDGVFVSFVLMTMFRAASCMEKRLRWISWVLGKVVTAFPTISCYVRSRAVSASFPRTMSSLKEDQFAMAV